MFLYFIKLQIFNFYITFETPTFISSEDTEDSMLFEEIHRPGSSEVQTATKKIMTLQLSAALDKYKVSCRDAVHLLIACVENISLNPTNFIINRFSIKKES